MVKETLHSWGAARRASQREEHARMMNSRTALAEAQNLRCTATR